MPGSMLFANAGLRECLCSGIIRQRRFCGACAYALSRLTPFQPPGYKCRGKTISPLSVLVGSMGLTCFF